MESSNQNILYKSDKTDIFFRKPHTATIAFALGLILFLLPFAELKCGSTTLVRNTGIGIALGDKWKAPMLAGYDDIFKNANSTIREDQKNSLNGGPNIFTLVAIAAGLAGLAFSLSQLKPRHVAGIGAGLLAALMLIAMMIQFKIILKTQIADKGKSADMGFDMSSVLKISFTIWYYLSVVLFFAASLFSYKHHKIEEQDAINSSLDFEFQEKERNDRGLISS